MVTSFLNFNAFIFFIYASLAFSKKEGVNEKYQNAHVELSLLYTYMFWSLLYMCIPWGSENVGSNFLSHFFSSLKNGIGYPFKMLFDAIKLLRIFECIVFLVQLPFFFHVLYPKFLNSGKIHVAFINLCIAYRWWKFGVRS